MRRASLLLLGLVFPAACLSKSDPTPLPGVPEGGAPDVTVLPPPPPPPPGDAGPAALDADAGPSPVTVTVLRGATPEANATVVFQDSQGVVVDTVQTDTLGRASRVVAADTLVTVATSFAGANGTERRLLTFVGVQPGDGLTAFAPTAPAATHTITVNIPTGAPGGAQGFTAYVGNNRCSEMVFSGDANVLFTAPYCAGGPTVAALVIAGDGEGGRVASTFVKGLPLPTGATTVSTLPAWSTTFGSFDLSVTNGPASSIDLSLAQIANASPWRESFPATPSGGAASRTFITVPGYADGIQSDLSSLQLIASSRALYRSLGKRVAATVTADSLDMAQLLPTVDTVTLDQTTMTRPLVSWTTSASMATADGGFVTYGWNDTIDGGGFVTTSWSFVVPANAISVRTPALPTAIASWAPTQPVTPPAVGFIESDLLATYSDVRQRYSAFPLPDLQGGTPLPPTLPQAGSLRVTANGVYPQ